MTNVKSKFRFQVSPWFEVFFALQALTDPGSRIHQGWKEQALRRIPGSFHKQFARIGGSSYIWPVLADTLLDVPLTLPFEDRVAKLSVLPTRDLQRTIFEGTFHEAGPVGQLLSGRISLSRTIARVSKAKKEWLAFLGLYPLVKEAPLYEGLSLLLRAPAEFRKIVVDLLEIFWKKEFKQTWELIKPGLEHSREEKERLFQSCSLEEFVRIALLRIEIDERKGLLRAVRGGYTLMFKNLQLGVILPSAFNDKRHWTCYDADPAAVVAFFPYFDPAISLKQIHRAGAAEAAEPELDPALIFKALGDTTRYAIASLLAREPHTSSDLARKLSLTAPTVSHHIHVLREAGLLEEKVHGNAVLLSLKRAVLEELSALVTRSLYQGSEKIDLKKTRRTG